MEKIEIINAIEAILFAVGRPVLVEEIIAALDIEPNEVNIALEELSKKYSVNSGISFVKVKNGYQLVTNKQYYKYVSVFVQNNKKENLSAACLEVLSIIAYNPKITKSEIENIRGASSDSQVAKLIEYGLVEEVGRLKVPGRPAIFEVTNEFLKSMGINSIEDLPDFENMKKNTQVEEIEAKQEV